MEFPLSATEYQRARRRTAVFAFLTITFAGLAHFTFPQVPEPPPSGAPDATVSLSIATLLLSLTTCCAVVGAYHAGALLVGRRQPNPALLRPVSPERLARRRFLAATCVLYFVALALAAAFDPYKLAEPSHVTSDAKYILVEHGRSYSVSAAVFHARMWLCSLWMSAFFAPWGLIIGYTALQLTKGRELVLAAPRNQLRPTGAFVTDDADRLHL